MTRFRKSLIYYCGFSPFGAFRSGFRVIGLAGGSVNRTIFGTVGWRLMRDVHRQRASWHQLGARCNAWLRHEAPMISMPIVVIRSGSWPKTNSPSSIAHTSWT